MCPAPSIFFTVIIPFSTHVCVSSLLLFCSLLHYSPSAEFLGGDTQLERRGGVSAMKNTQPCGSRQQLRQPQYVLCIRNVFGVIWVTGNRPWLETAHRHPWNSSIWHETAQKLTWNSSLFHFQVTVDWLETSTFGSSPRSSSQIDMKQLVDRREITP